MLFVKILLRIFIADFHHRILLYSVMILVRLLIVDKYIKPTLSSTVEYFLDQEFVESDGSDGHPCDRPCTYDGKPKECNFVFVVQAYSTMSQACKDCPFNITDCYQPRCITGDGRRKMIYAVNGQMPGPTIKVCENDNIIVKVKNDLPSEGTSIHWHGVLQNGTPYMDGVSYVTQCPILPGESFDYKFSVAMPGTYFWHSHIGSQRSDGLFGPLIIYPRPRNDPYKHLYQGDFCMTILDWMMFRGDHGVIRRYHDRTYVSPETILVNGMGRYYGPRNKKIPYSTVKTPFAVFNVDWGSSYRFRLIDAGSETCPIEVSIDKHAMQIISLDSNDIEPVEVDAITVWPGERVDFIINADQEIDSYWIRYKGRGECEASSSESGVFQTAILRYNGASTTDPQAPIGYNITDLDNYARIFNPYDRKSQQSTRSYVSIPELNSMVSDDPSLKAQSDEQHFISFNLNRLDNYDFHRKNLYGFYQVPPNKRIGTFQLNHISLRMQSFPLLSQWNEIQSGSLCNRTHHSQKDCKKEHCACTHVIQVGLNKTVELIFVGGNNSPVEYHPLHLHGHFFRVIAMGHLGEDVTIEKIQKLDQEGKIIRRLSQAPKKDTMKSPSGGYIIVRFYADNPGYWFFHCHYEQHKDIGMALVFKVGEHEDLPKKPSGFPVCHNFLPFKPPSATLVTTELTKTEASESKSWIESFTSYFQTWSSYYINYFHNVHIL